LIRTISRGELIG